MQSTKYRTDAAVLAIVLEDMQAAGLVDLKTDQEISLAPAVEVSETPAISLAETALAVQGERARRRA